MEVAFGWTGMEISSNWKRVEMFFRVGWGWKRLLGWSRTGPSRGTHQAGMKRKEVFGRKHIKKRAELWGRAAGSPLVVPTGTLFAWSSARCSTPRSAPAPNPWQRPPGSSSCRTNRCTWRRPWTKRWGWGLSCRRGALHRRTWGSRRPTVGQ